MGLDNSAEAPLPVRVVAKSISDWVSRLGRVWVKAGRYWINHAASQPPMRTSRVVTTKRLKDWSAAGLCGGRAVSELCRGTMRYRMT